MIDEQFNLLTDYGKIKRVLGWQPEYDLSAMVADMLRNLNLRNARTRAYDEMEFL